MQYFQLCTRRSRETTVSEKKSIFSSRSGQAIPNDRFFSIRKHIQVSFYEVKNTLSDGRTSVLYMPVNGMRHPPPVRGPKEEPLAQRGWVLQERMLSPRILHYTQQRPYWECRNRASMNYVTMKEEDPYCCKHPFPWDPSHDSRRGLVRCLRLDGRRD
jgi:hypothetical protein